MSTLRNIYSTFLLIDSRTYIATALCNSLCRTLNTTKSCNLILIYTRCAALYCNKRKGTFGHFRKMSSRISLRNPCRLIIEGILRLKLTCSKTEKIHVHKKPKLLFRIRLRVLRRLILRKCPNVPFDVL